MFVVGVCVVVCCDHDGFVVDVFFEKLCRVGFDGMLWVIVVDLEFLRDDDEIVVVMNDFFVIGGDGFFCGMCIDIFMCGLMFCDVIVVCWCVMCVMVELS